MNWLITQWNNLPENRRNALLLATLILMAFIATISLLEDSGVKAVLYQAF